MAGTIILNGRTYQEHILASNGEIALFDNRFEVVAETIGFQVNNMDTIRFYSGNRADVEKWAESLKIFNII